ncbi:MAG: hypothetical protein H5T33_00265 [Candidatus Methanosuratus sp.]|nr:hypothetical protein [Candidatus Methanosuratincola sp.]
MGISIENKFSREIRSFFSLAVINIAFSGIAMAIGVSLAVTNILALLDGWSVINIAASAVGIAAFALAIRWLIAVAELLSGVDDIKDEYSKVKGNQSPKALTGLIVRLTAHYRSNRQLISRLILLSRAAGVCFIANGALLLLQMALNLPADWTGILASLAAAAVNFGVGVAGISIPHFFKRYSSCWEVRLKEITQAEEGLSVIVGRE